ncbi:sulfotransferase 4A1-like [Saccostrea cucullata]|uniref:sulfotransferase 4A1-like n=1 Tax=Saccostrea cuccullata TaxID=36930 RepID=UPI002ED627CF
MNPRAFVYLSKSLLTGSFRCRTERYGCRWFITHVKLKQERYFHRNDACYQKKGSRNQANDYVFPFKSETRRKGLLISTYGSIAFGICILGVIFYSKVIKTGLRRRGGFIDIIDENCSKSNMVLFNDTVLPNFVEKKMKGISNFGVRESDVWIVGFPRSGMTWVQEIIYLVQTLDFEGSRQIDCDERIPYLEFPTPSLQELSERPSPRILKTHLPLKLLPEEINSKQPKIVYIARNPKDVVVSYFYLVTSLHALTRYRGKLSDFVDSFLKDRVPYSPWSRHVLDFWEIKDQPNVLFLTYEDLKMDLERSIKRVAIFLQRDLSKEDIQRIAKHCSFVEMKKNPAVNHQWLTDLKYRNPTGAEFLREGRIGDWQNYLSKEQDERLNVKIALKLRQTGLFFQYTDPDPRPMTSDP